MFSNTKRLVTFVKTLAVIQFTGVALWVLRFIEINDGYVCVWLGKWICIWPDGSTIVFAWAAASSVAYYRHKNDK